MKINKFNINNLRNDEHDQFGAAVGRVVYQAQPIELGILDEFNVFTAKRKAEDEALKAINKSVYTAQIQDADVLRDNLFTGMSLLAKGALYHYEESVRGHAANLKILLDTYGNIAKKPLNEQTSAVRNLIQDLRSEKYAASAAAVGIAAWTDKLADANQVFDQLVHDRFDEAASKTSIVLKQARAEVDTAYRAMVEMINALAVVASKKNPQSAAKYEAVIKTLNAVIDKYEAILKARRGRSGKQGSGGQGTENGDTDSEESGDE